MATHSELQSLRSLKTGKGRREWNQYAAEGVRLLAPTYEAETPGMVSFTPRLRYFRHRCRHGRRYVAKRDLRQDLRIVFLRLP